MKKSKKIFLGVAILFLIGLAYVSYDISSRTTFPGSKPQLKERLEDQFFKADSVNKDSIKTVDR